MKTTTIKESEKEYEITDPSIKEIFDIVMQYKIHNDDLSIDDVFITELKGTVKVSIWLSVVIVLIVKNKKLSCKS